MTGKAKIKSVKVKGPSKAKRKKVATYKVKIKNSGAVTANGVRLKVSGKGVSFNTSAGKIGCRQDQDRQGQGQVQEEGQGQGEVQGDLEERRKQDRQKDHQGALTRTCQPGIRLPARPERGGHRPPLSFQ